ncbi:MAG: RNA polymerase sigma factor [Bacteroidota bacterium]
MSIEEVKQLGQQHRSEFRALALTLTRDEERAKDLLQDAIYQILKHKDSFRPGTNFVAWVKTIIRNTFLSGYRRQQRRRTLVERDQPTGQWLGERTVDNSAESALGTEEIMDLIEQLPARYRQAFLLHYQGIKYREIALRTGVPIGTAKSRVHTARVQLRQWLTVLRA